MNKSKIIKGIIFLVLASLILVSPAMAQTDSTPPVIEDKNSRQIDSVWVKTIDVSDFESGVERIEVLKETNGTVYSVDPTPHNNSTVNRAGTSLYGDGAQLIYWANWTKGLFNLPRTVTINIKYTDPHKGIRIKIRARNGDGYWNESEFTNPPAINKAGPGPKCNSCHGANQRIGTYDTTLDQLIEQNCRNCHTSGVPDRHHNLVPTGEYSCNNCHPIITTQNGQSVLLDRNCIVCHNGSVFYANPNLMAGRPHHNTSWAQGRDCKQCHGGFVDNYNDGHYIPTYNVSLVTPDTSFKVINSTTGKKWGGCEACHEEYHNATPIIQSNNNTHHNEIINVTGGINGNTCNWCHSGNGSELNIRKCEDCHSISTVHNIQYNYSGTNGDFGWGHIGDNWDCNGCHAFWDAGTTYPSSAIIPDIFSINPSKLTSGIPTVVTIDGTNFVNDQYTSVVSVDETRLTPSSITDNQIVVTVPALSSGIHTIQVVKTGDVTDRPSRLSTLTVVDPVDITSAKITKRVKNPPSVEITILGTGFGPQPDSLYQDLGVWVSTKKGTTTVKADIVNWTATNIVVNVDSANVRDSITVKALYGQDNAIIGG